MFSQLSQRLTNTLDKLRGVGRLTESNIQEALQAIRRALLEADVALPVVKQFIEQVQENALGEKITTKVRPGDAFIKLVQDELTHTLGDKQSEINLSAKPPVVIMVVGLQGSGKTTSLAKLANWLKQTKNKKEVMVVSADVHRPAAIEQLATLAQQIGVNYFPSNAQQNPQDIVKNAISTAEKQFQDILLIDTAGRLHVDADMMEELKALHQIAKPTETLLVVDSMAGQDAANIAKSFHEAVDLTGMVLTKTDGDARGGAALSMRMITGKPIKFVGVGEKIDALEAFHPERVASRILGMGDIVSLVEQAQSKADKAEAEKIAKKIKTGKRFDFTDFLSQLKQMQKMGGLASLMNKLPNMGALPKGAAAMMDDKLLVKMEAMILSMTHQERRFPACINGSRKRRIAQGSGTQIQDINKLLKQFEQMQKMLKSFKGDKMAQQMKKLQSMQAQLPPELRSQLGTGNPGVMPDWMKKK